MSIWSNPAGWRDEKVKYDGQQRRTQEALRHTRGQKHRCERLRVAMKQVEGGNKSKGRRQGDGRQRPGYSDSSQETQEAKARERKMDEAENRGAAIEKRDQDPDTKKWQTLARRPLAQDTHCLPPERGSGHIR